MWCRFWMTCTGILFPLQSFNKRLVNVVTHQITSQFRNSKPLPGWRECKHPNQFGRMHSVMSLSDTVPRHHKPLSLLGHWNTALDSFTTTNSKNKISKELVSINNSSAVIHRWSLKGQRIWIRFCTNHEQAMHCERTDGWQAAANWEVMDWEIWIFNLRDNIAVQLAAPPFPSQVDSLYKENTTQSAWRTMQLGNLCGLLPHLRDTAAHKKIKLMVL